MNESSTIPLDGSLDGPVWFWSIPTKKLVPTIPVICPTVYTGELTFVMGSVFAGNSVKSNPAGLLHEGSPRTQGLLSVCWYIGYPITRLSETAPAVTGASTDIATMTETNMRPTTRFFMASILLSNYNLLGKYGAIT